MKFENPFDQKELSDLSQWNLEEKDLKHFRGLYDMKNEIRTAHLIDCDKSDGVAILLSSEKKLDLSLENEELRVLKAGNSQQRVLSTRELVRGFKNEDTGCDYFYFIEKNEAL